MLGSPGQQPGGAGSGATAGAAAGSVAPAAGGAGGIASFPCGWTRAAVVSGGWGERDEAGGGVAPMTGAGNRLWSPLSLPPLSSVGELFLPKRRSDPLPLLPTRGCLGGERKWPPFFCLITFCFLLWPPAPPPDSSPGPIAATAALPSSQAKSEGEPGAAGTEENEVAAALILRPPNMPPGPAATAAAAATALPSSRAKSEGEPRAVGAEENEAAGQRRSFSGRPTRPPAPPPQPDTRREGVLRIPRCSSARHQTREATGHNFPGPAPAEEQRGMRGKPSCFVPIPPPPSP